MIATDSQLQVAKERLLIPALWHLLNLLGKPGRCCRLPFREDRNPSFSIYDGGRRWKDHATGEGGDGVDFLAKALGLSNEDACRKLIELAGVSPFPNERTGLGNLVHSHDAEEEEKARKRKSWPIFQQPSADEIEAISELRSVSVEGVSLAADRGVLFCAGTPEGRAWIITDSRRKNAQARRLNGQPWAHIDAKKAWTLPGSQAAWPVGLRESSSFPAIALVEGSADLIAAFHLAWCAGVESRVAPVAMFGGGLSIPEESCRTSPKSEFESSSTMTILAEMLGHCGQRS
jgi:DNA primase (bacterial type)